MGSEATHSKAAVLISLMLLVFGSTSTALQSFTTELEDGHWYNSGAKSADSDGDNVSDMDDSCPNGQTGWNSTNLTDYDSDGCRDSDEDDDDDNDEVLDGDDSCPKGVLGWTSSTSTDYDGDGCRDTSEETDEDND